MSATGIEDKSKRNLLDHKMICNPRFMLGVKSDVQGGLHCIDDNIIMYPCGHNIVFYDSNTKSQRFIPGIEGTESINTIALNSTKKILAVCETSK